MRILSFGLKVAAAVAVSLVGYAQAATVTCPNAPIDRYVTVTGAKAGGLCAYKEGNFQGDNFSTWNLTLIEKDIAPNGGGSGLLGYTQNGGGNAGTWTAAASQWNTYGNLYLAFHFGNGGGSPDSFIVQLQQSATSGTWSLGALLGSLNGLSNIYLLGDGSAPPQEVPEPGTVALVGISLLGLALARRRKA